ncbi:Protein CBG08702 [Caenorhabditis briggsae]|uniref:Protein CBG08702 n=1 Tax=Caenorhabditis briggsae TaxID=6238 RepID=A8X6S1_CAEBR|nr:Protein CBG08702 [Caenorhabditis briggsae]CAP28332.2 Protein CBG08702 [Caenorhabditis briggsae]
MLYSELFHRLMANSGSAFCDFAIRPKEMQAKVFREFAKFQGYTGNDSTSLLRWYQDQNPKIFTETSKFKRPASGFLSFIPNFDGDFFPKPFDELRKMAPKMDVLVTVTEYEGLIMAAFQPKNKTFDEVVSEIFAADRVKDPEATKKTIVDFYMKNVDDNDTNALTKKMIEFIGDAEFNIGTLYSVRSSIKYGNNVYLGSFDYFNKYSENPVTMLFPFKAAYHGSDLRYILGESMEKYKTTEEELSVMDMMGTFVANFAKYGNPNGKNGPEIWEKYSEDHPERYFKIDYPKGEMKENFQNGRLNIYDEINKNAIKYQEIVYGRKI